MVLESSRFQSFSKIAGSGTSAGSLEAWQSRQDIDKKWDSFLSSSIYGHFYQSSIWAQVRTLDGWQPLVTIITLNDEIIGGFQILYRNKRLLGKIGLLLKGPVINSDDKQATAFVIDTIKKTAKKEGIRALIIQPQDKNDKIEKQIKISGFTDNHLDFVIKTNTVQVNLRGSEEEIFKRIDRKKRQNIKKTAKNGINVREGGRDDLNLFYEFMTETCRRQKVKPSPSTLGHLKKMWDVFVSEEKIKLFLSQHNGKAVSGCIVVTFSKTAFLWKYGWSGNCREYSPNELLYWEIFRWAKRNGYHIADLGAVSMSIAETAQQGGKPGYEDTKTYSFFKNHLGGEVVPLSKGFVYIPNPLVRLAYGILMPFINRKPFLKKKLLFSSE
ncbi:MAG TPA: peptidoglycan bridge formation glycyltransferase FemA/FemB family protein [Acidobacteriota bacterium]|nr:peptidoglycan bridge formation glycyltransferase FemA/FemB family protein [Acidobacteriota bacterium]